MLDRACARPARLTRQPRRPAWQAHVAPARASVRGPWQRPRFRSTDDALQEQREETEARHTAAEPLQHSRQQFPSKLDMEIARMAIPSFATMIMAPLMGMVGTAMVGHLGSSVLAGVGLAATLNGCLIWPLSFLQVLTVPRVATAVAQGNWHGARSHVAQALWLAVPVGLLTMTLLLNRAEACVAAFRVAPSIMVHAQAYLSAACVAHPFILVQYVLIGSFRALKDARTPLYAALLANIANVLLAVLFIYGLKMGAQGAALAMAVSNVLSCAVLFSMLSRRGLLRWQEFSQGPDMQVLRPLIVEGSAVSVRTYAYLGVTLLSAVLLGRTDPATLAAHEIMKQIFSFMFQCSECLNISNQTLVATAIAKGQVQHARNILFRHLLYAVIMVALVASVLLPWPGAVLGVFSKDPAIVQAAASVLPIILLAAPIDACCSLLDGTLTACGQAVWVAKQTVIAASICLCVLATMPHVSTVNLLSVWAALKLIVLVKLPLDWWRVFKSRDSPLADVFSQADAAPAAPAVQPAVQLAQVQEATSQTQVGLKAAI